MMIQLSKEELEYLNHAINLWEAEALKHIQNMNNYQDDYDGYDPMPAGKCAYLTARQVEYVKNLNARMNTDWINNEGRINLAHYCDLIFKFSIHLDMVSNPIFLSMNKKVAEAKAGVTTAIQTHSLFGEAKTSSAPGLKVKIPGPEDETPDSEDEATCSSSIV